MSELPVKFSVVVPVYNAHSTIERLLSEVYKHMAEQGDFEVILVDDCSTDDTWEILSRLYQEYKNLRIVRLSKNFGQSAATLCGIYRARGKSIITIDDDLQYPPSEIPKLIRYFAENDFYMVLGIPQKKKQPLFYLIFEQLIRLFFSLFKVGHLNGKNISSSFRIFRSDLNFSKDFPQGRVFSIHVATLMISPLHIGEVYIEHRHSGIKKSRYSFFGRVEGFLQLLLEFNVNPTSWIKWPLMALIATALAFWSFQGYATLLKHIPVLLFFLGLLLVTGQFALSYYLKQINARQLGVGPYLVIEEHG